RGERIASPHSPFALGVAGPVRLVSPGMSAHRPRWLSRRQLSRCAGVLLLFFVAAGPALPAERLGEAARDEPVIQLPPVQVTAPAPLPETLPRHWVPGAVDILDRTEIGPPRRSVLPDVLERLQIGRASCREREC